MPWVALVGPEIEENLSLRNPDFPRYMSGKPRFDHSCYSVGRGQLGLRVSSLKIAENMLGARRALQAEHVEETGVVGGAAIDGMFVAASGG